MKLSDLEFHAMNTPIRRWGQKYFELPLFMRLGFDIKNKDVLEIGCGSGYAGYLMNRFAPKSYIGLDVMEEQIQLAKYNYPQFEFMVQDATELNNFADGSKDIVIVFGVLHHIREWRKTIDEIVRVLRPNGKIFLEEPRGKDIKIFDFFFRWGHPDIDFSLKDREIYFSSQAFQYKKQWTPLLTMYRFYK